MDSQTNIAFSGELPAAPDGFALAIPQATSPGNVTLISHAVPSTGGVNAQTGTGYTLDDTDRGKLVTFSNASAVSVTIATSLVNFLCAMQNLGAGTVTISTGSPAVGNINGSSTLTLTTGHGVWLFWDGTNWEAVVSAPATPLPIGVAGVTIDGGTSSPATGSKGYLRVPFACTVTGWALVADASGSAQITVKKCDDAGFPSTASIVASMPPALSSQQKATSTSLTGWTPAIAVGDWLEFNLDSVTTCKRLTLELTIQRS